MAHITFWLTASAATAASPDAAYALPGLAHQQAVNQSANHGIACANLRPYHVKRRGLAIHSPEALTHSAPRPSEITT